MKRYSLIFSGIVFFISCFYLYENRDQFFLFRSINILNILCLLFLILAFFFVTGYTFRLVVNLLNVELTLAETFGLSILTNFGNYLGPTSPGSIIKAVYLKAVKGLEYSKFTSVFFASAFLGVFMTGIFGVILFFSLKIAATKVSMILLAVCWAFVIVAIVPFVLHIPQITSQRRIAQMLKLALEGFDAIRNQKMGLMRIGISYVAQFALSAFIFQSAFYALGISVSYEQALAVGVYTTIVNFVSITPSNLGIQEAMIALIFSVLGQSFSVGVMGAALIRVVHLLITFSLTPIFTYLLFKRKGLSLAGLDKK
ncbi:MAG: lysylphosphatidylglycerol synthase transmembrane domain-containing protein [Candidatus Omnitrophota bacterium]